MIKLKELKVKSFKSLINTEIKEFGEVNMFYGFNNSGKSNIFRFLDLLFTKKIKIEAIEVGEESEELIDEIDFWNGVIYDKPYIFSNNDRSKSIEFEVILSISNSTIPDNEELSEYGYIAEGDITDIEIKGVIKEINSNDSNLHVEIANLNGKEFYFFEDGIPYGFREEEDLNIDLSESILRLFNNCIEFIDTDRNLELEVLQDNNSSLLLNNKNFKNWVFDLNMDAEKNERFNDLLDFLSSFEFSKEALDMLGGNTNSFPFREYTDIGFTKFGNRIEVMLKNKENRLPLSSFGTGIQQFFYILTRIFLNDSRIIIIEELELNLSPLYQIEIMRFLRTILGKKFDQILFSSHSPLFTLKGSTLVDIIQHVQIDNAGRKGTSIESYKDAAYNEDCENYSYFSLLYS